jgi:biotin operon repressor
MEKKRLKNVVPAASLIKNKTLPHAELSPLQKKLLKKASQPKVSVRDVLILCKRGISLHEIAQQLKITSVSAAKYIERLLRKGYEIKIDTYIKPEKRSLVQDALLSLQTSSINRVSEFLGGKATEEEIRIVRGFLQGKEISE